MIKLSARELQVVALYLESGRLRPVAEAMGVSIHTARRQKESAMRKLGASNSAELLVAAIRKGLVEVEEKDKVS